MNVKQAKKRAAIDLGIVFISAFIPMVIYLFFEQTWRGLNQSESVAFGLKFFVQGLLAYCLSGLGFTVVMVFRKEKFREYGLVKENFAKPIFLSVLLFIPHFIFLLLTKGFTGYIPMSGAILFDSIMARPLAQKVVGMAIVFAIWGFCEGFTYVFVASKINRICPPKNGFLNLGAFVGGVLCVAMHGGISFTIPLIFDAITMFIFVYGILVVKDIYKNAWGVIFAFFFLWNAFP